MKGAFKLIGTGASPGVPVIGCDCQVCTSTDPRNQRMRTSAVISYDGRAILIDSGPDYRQQALRFGINDIDGVIYTHAHADHTAGIDDLRIYYFRKKKALPCLMSKSTYSDLLNRYDYIFGERDHNKGLPVLFDTVILPENHGDFSFQGLSFFYLTFEQGGMPVNGFRFGDLAYISDIKYYEDSIFQQLAGVKTLVVSALRDEPSIMHLTVDEAIEFSRKIGAKNTYLTHIAHDINHTTRENELPPGIHLGYDGLELSFTNE
jgi:phosphoribosyl 1,2-cyclic phosphate phosphodiesterase